MAGINPGWNQNDVAWFYGQNNAVAGNSTRGMLMVVNIADRMTGGRSQTLTIPIPAESTSNTVTVVGESRTLTASAGTFSDTFAPYATHIYTFPINAPGPTVPGKTTFECGWWAEESGSTSKIGTYAAGGQNSFVFDGHITDTSRLADKQAWLTAAANASTKVYVGVNKWYTPEISLADMTTMINGMKGYASVRGWFYGDEPDLYNSRTGDATAMFQSFYNTIKAADPNHPVFISLAGPSWDYSESYFNQAWTNCQSFYQWADVIGYHVYPFDTGDAEFAGIEVRRAYDKWKFFYDSVKPTGKPFVATGQMYGPPTFPEARNPTAAENRWQVYSALVQGIKAYMWWEDTYQATGGTALINAICVELNSIAQELNNGAPFALIGTTDNTPPDPGGNPIVTVTPNIKLDHETSNLTQWTTTATNSGNLTVTAAAALNGTGYGMRFNFANTTAMYGRHTLASVRDFTYRFYFNIANLTMANSTSIQFHRLYAVTRDDVILNLRLNCTSSGTFQLEFLAVDDVAFNDITGAPTVTIAKASTHLVDIHLVRATTNVSADGSITWSVDRVQAGTWINRDNYDAVGTGNWYLYAGAFATVPAGMSGQMYIDEIIGNADGVPIDLMSTSPYGPIVALMG